MSLLAIPQEPFSQTKQPEQLYMMRPRLRCAFEGLCVGDTMQLPAKATTPRGRKRQKNGRLASLGEGGVHD
jgi:hypothetical protein